LLSIQNKHAGVELLRFGLGGDALHLVEMEEIHFATICHNAQQKK